MKSASVRTLPLAVTSSAERSAACATCTVTRSCRVASDMFWPLTSAVLNVPPSGHRTVGAKNPTAPAALTDRPMRMCSLGDVRNLVCTYLLPVPLHDLVAGCGAASGGRATVGRRESGHMQFPVCRVDRRVGVAQHPLVEQRVAARDDAGGADPRRD